MAAARPLPMPSPAAPAPVTIATLSCRPQLSGTSKRCASAMSSSGGGFYHPPSWPSRGGRLERVASAERHAQHADRVRRELVLEPVAPRGEARLAHVDGARGLERIGRVEGGAVALGNEDVVLHGGCSTRARLAPRPSCRSPCSRRCRARCRSVLGALAIFAFRSAWNDFLWPLIAVNKPDMFPLPVALALLRGAYAAESYGPIMAGAVLSSLPLLIVFLVANRRIVEGVRVSALKG